MDRAAAQAPHRGPGQVLPARGLGRGGRGRGVRLIRGERSDGESRAGPHRSSFEDLTPHELHAILALRQRVFIVEQGCAFQEIDGLDPVADHVWTAGADGGIAAYLRMLDDGGATRIGRVVTAPEHRGTGAGAALMRAVLGEIAGPVVLGAQVRVRGFYERLGFAVDGPEYDEDRILHVPMRRG